MIKDMLTKCALKIKRGYNSINTVSVKKNIEIKTEIHPENNPDKLLVSSDIKSNFGFKLLDFIVIFGALTITMACISKICYLFRD